MNHSITGAEFNSKGYLKSFNAWNRDIALAIADEFNLRMTECHWKVVNFLREYYMEYEIAPMPREIIRRIGKQIEPHANCSKKQLESLFAEGGCKLACKIAGLPDSYCRAC
jgi:tRNA 2-thiouridine synthesizing protein E